MEQDLDTPWAGPPNTQIDFRRCQYAVFRLPNQARVPGLGGFACPGGW